MYMFVIYFIVHGLPFDVTARPSDLRTKLLFVQDIYLAHEEKTFKITKLNHINKG
jgi:hypothetical protein